MLNAESIKNLLVQIKEKEYKVPENSSAFEIALEMMQHIGSVDAELRDELIYTTLVKWTMNQEFSSDQLRKFLQIALDDQHLFWKIGEVDTDSVFTRSFSALVIPIAIYAHRQENYLNVDEIIHIKNKLIQYLELENDVRGFVVGKGWAHAIAHAADGLYFVSSLPTLNKWDLIDILEIIQKKLCIDHYIYINEEDERMVSAIISILHRDLIEEDYLVEWIHRVGKSKNSEKLPEGQILKGNAKSLLRSLYFRILKEKGCNKYTDTIIQTLDVIENW